MGDRRRRALGVQLDGKLGPESHGAKITSDAPGLQENGTRIGAKVVRPAKCVTSQMAEVAVPRDLFASILGRTQWFSVSPPLAKPR